MEKRKWRKTRRYSKCCIGLRRAVSGNIGSGKTTLCNYLKTELPGSRVYFEKYELNQYLEPFYEHLKKNAQDLYNPFALPVQMNFLGQRIRIEKEVDTEILAQRQSYEAEQQPQIHVIDRSIFEDNEIFAKNQLDSGMMTQAEYEKYLEVYLSNIDQIIKPDFVVILTQDVKVLHQRIVNRGREMEKDMSIDYLQNLQHRYDHALVPFLEKRGINYLKTSPDLSLDAGSSNRKVLEAILAHLQLPLN